MKITEEQLKLYAVTDSTWLNGRSLAEAVREAVEGGATIVQYREKHAGPEEALREAEELCALCHKLHVPFIVNDDVSLAIACGADGVHVGQDDTDPAEARMLLGPDRILGVSAHDPEEAVKAEKAGADYLGCGAVFGSTTKQNVRALTPELLREITASVRIPAVAIGGITAENLSQLKGCRIAGAAVVSALFAAPDIRKAVEELREITDTL